MVHFLPPQLTSYSSSMAVILRLASSSFQLACVVTAGALPC
uniref:Uncharacterized protein n=1 Tax=Arundo donax TaxID=35708 RepID=A0A0A9DYJ8_ARUDO